VSNYNGSAIADLLDRLSFSGAIMPSEVFGSLIE
jgi:hypothetical protein